MEAEMSWIKKVVGTLSTTFPKILVKPEDSAEVTVERVTTLMHSVQGKVEELGAQLVPSTPAEVREAKRVKVAQLVKEAKAITHEYGIMFVDVVQTWSDLGEHPVKVKVHAQLAEVQRHEEEMKLAIKNMSPLEKMQQAKTTKALKQQVDSLYKQEESLIARLDPLQEVSMTFARVNVQNQGVVTAFVEDVKAKLE